jgi:CHRD domain
VGTASAGRGIAAGEFEEFVQAIRAGVTYVNVHSVVFPGGDIRSQIGRHGGHQDGN